eukprot:6205233-Pleurochrysis_carterae.AAC.1
MQTAVSRAAQRALRRLHLEVVSLLEVVDELLERELAPLVDVEPVPERPLLARVADRPLGRGDGLGEAQKRQRQIGKGVLEVLNLLVGLQQLEHLDGDEAGHHGGGGGDGRDDLARDLLGTVAVGLGDDIVPRAQIGGGRDKVDVEVRVVVLKASKRQKSPNNVTDKRQTREKVVVSIRRTLPRRL